MLKRWVLALCLISSGCSSGFEIWDYSFDDGLSIESIEDAFSYCRDNIMYSQINEAEWQLPHETIEKGRGDCEDFALLFMYLVYKYRETDAVYLVRLDMVNAPGHPHFIAQVDGTFYDPTAGYGFEYKLNPIWKITDIHNYGHSIFIAMVK